jgi:membrane-associated protease RseP (regulator of RpoE activity)
MRLEESADSFEIEPYPEYATFVRSEPPRRWRIPVLLFALTCVSTFFVGVTAWVPLHYVGLLIGDDYGGIALRRMILTHWDDGQLYTAAVLSILLCHEMGHYDLTRRHRIRATLPFFLPLPITPIGTLGAVIGMDGLRANRRQIFDIGIAGPLAGLVVAIPVLWLGVLQLDLTDTPSGMFQLDMPIAIQWMAWLSNSPGLGPNATIGQGQLNPLLMAGWVGLLVTGLNMLPVSQLDGGHVIYALFGPSSRWIARLFMFSAICYVVMFGKKELTLMIGLILLIGTDHPPTSDDSVKLGWFRTALACASLAIPVLCIPPDLIMFE